MDSSLDNVTPYEKRAHGWRGIALQGCALFGLWLVLSGRFDLFHIAAGVVSVGVVMLLNRRVSSVQFFHGDVSEWEQLRFEHLLRFVPWLVWEIVEGSLQVAYAVLHPKMPIAPILVRFRVKLPTGGAKVLLGNVMTLTPGTVTLGLQEDEFLIHALRRPAVLSIIDGTMPRWIALLFDEEAEHLVTDVQFIETSGGV